MGRIIFLTKKEKKNSGSGIKLVSFNSASNGLSEFLKNVIS